MASRNPALDALKSLKGGSGNPALDALRLIDASQGLAAPAQPRAPTLAETIDDPNSYRNTTERFAIERGRAAGEGSISNLKAPEGTVMNALRGAGITTVEAWKQAGAGIRMQMEDAFGPAIDRWIESNMPNSGLSNEDRRRVFGETNAMRDYRAADRRIEEATPQFNNWWADAAYGGLSSLIQTAPGTAAGIALGPGIGLAILGGQVEAQSYGKYRERGADPALALAGAIGEGSTEILTEKIPMGWLTDKFGAVGFKKFLTEYLAREMPTEQVATFVQDAIDTAIANPDKSWNDFWGERLDAAGKTAVATFIQSGAYAGLNTAVNKIAENDIDDARRRADPDINQAAVDAFSPARSRDTRIDVPLSPEDRSSTISNDVLQAGKNAVADALAVAGSAAPRPARAARTVPTAGDNFSRMVQITLGSESGNRDYDAQGNVLTSGSGAKGRMQVLDGTNTDPGFGVRPAQNNSLEERARVGRDYLAAMLKRYGGDPAKAWAAYNWGPGNLDAAIQKHGDNWLAAAPAETRSYVMKNLNQLGEAGFNAETGDIGTIASPEQATMDAESPMDFAARILGADWMNDEGGALPTDAAPALAPQETATPAPETDLASTAPADVRGEAIDDEWSRFSPESGTLGIPRGEMPQIKAEHRGAFANFLRGRGMGSVEVDVPAINLKPSQTEYSEGGVSRAANRDGGNRAILVSSDGYIVDGHHQWLAARDAGENIRAIQIDAPIDEVLAAAHEFPSSTVEDGASDATARAEAASRERARAAEARRRGRASIESDLLTYIAANGGIRDNEGHSLRRLRNLQRPIAGLGSLIRQNGRPLDMMREKMEEDGWLPEGSTVADMLDMVERASFNPVYHPASERAARGMSRDEEYWANREQADALDAVRTEAGQMGIEPAGFSDADMEYAAQLVLAEGYDVDHAIFAAIERGMLNDPTSYQKAVKEEYTNVPFDAEGATGWQAVENPFPESESRGAGPEGGERSEVDEGTARSGEGEAAQSGTREEGDSREGVTVEDTPSGKGVVVRNATPAQLEAIREALPEKASGMVGRDGGVTYSKKHEDAIRAVLQDSAKTPTSESVKPETAGTGSGQATPVASDARQESEQLSAAEAPATGTAPEHAHAAIGERGNRVSFPTPKDGVKTGKIARVRQTPEGRAVYDIDVDGGGLQNAFADEATILPDGVTNPVTPAKSGNRIFTDDMAERARARLRGKLSGSTVNSGVDPELLLDGIVLAGWHVEKGARKFADFARAMVADLGDQARPYLKSWYLGLKYDPRARALSGMDTIEAVDAFDVDAGFDQPVSDRVPMVARLLDDGPQREALLIQGFDALDINVQRSMLSQMVARLHDDEIAGIVVKAVPVDVVDMLIGQEGATQLILNDPAMLRRALTVPFNQPIPTGVSGFVNAVATLGQPKAAPAAISGSARTNDRVVPVEGNTALGAGQADIRQDNAPSGISGISPIPTIPSDQDTGGALPAEGAATVPPQAPAAEQGTATAAQPGRLETIFEDAFLSGRAFASITEARAFAAEQTGETYAPGTAQAKALDEQIESAVVRVARNIAVQNEGNPIAAYQRLVQLYDQQPRLGVRTSTSVEQQAYSTPVPLAYLASRLAGINQDTTVYEPSAGNGALLIDARPTYSFANELNPDRVAQLRAFLPGGAVTQEDATEYSPPQPVDAVIANPPFGPVKDDTGATVRFQVDSQYSTNEIDHAIAMKALEAMKDGGRAVLIVGGINKTITDPKKRADAYNAKAKREFYFKLYSQYNVTDHFTVDGSLYAKQGAGWPVDVIVINGRGQSSLRLPAVAAPRQYASWDALQEVLTNGGNAGAVAAIRGQDGNPAGEGSRAVSTDVGNSGSERAGGNNGRAGRDTAQQSQPVRAGLDNGQSSGVRVDAERAGVDQAAVDQQPGAIAGRDPVRPEVEENERQVAYQPGSRSNGMGTLVPVNMQTAISDALAALAQRRGDIDSYVADRLGYSAAELSESFGAEQVDAIALAIDNIERGAGFIIGDQTGIGKGRVNAAIIRYAIRSGRNPIFVTEKPNLYADMFRDMEDIGLPKMLGRDINAVMTNSGLTVPLGDKRTLKSGSDTKKHDAMLRDLSLKGLKAAGVDVLMTTYSQMQTVRGQATVRQEVIRALANGGVVMFDESHNAGGQQNVFKEAGAAPNRAEFARELVQGADGVFYSSATYAKRPDVMDLYAATDMKLAVEDLEALGEAIAKGGVPMQQVVAAMLARSGQYVRRERSFDGIAYNTPTIDVSREQYNNVASVLAAIQDFSEGYVADAVARVDEELRDSAENVAPDGSIGGAGASSTNFTAIMHNVVDQMLLAFAADAAADRAIDSIRNGEKPVLTLASTLETFIEDYANEVGAQEGDRIDITFADIFRRYLERTRRYTVKKPFAEKGEKGERRRLTDEQLGADGVRAFKEAQRLIDEAGIHTLPGSPIDHIIARVEKAGYAVSEITGRTMGIDYSGNETRLKKRGQGERSIKGRLATINGFNDGKIDAVILNKSGSTGLSLHASEKFKDQRKRRMILVQAEGNIDTHMQMLGRVHRTGQVVLPEYDQLVVGVPAARRPAAVLAKKMASLNANTTASRDSALTSSEVLDFMNVYGDEIAARMMEDEPEIHMRLGEPLADTDKGGLNREEAARKVTGRIPLLPIELQEELYERLEDEYRALIAQKDAAGENALEAKTFDFDAETVDRVEAQPPVPGSSSPFADGVYVERIRVKRTGKPIPAAEVAEMVADALELDMPAGSPSEALAALQQQAEAIDRTRLTETLRDAAAFAEKAIASVKDEGKKKEERDKLAANYKAFQAIRKAARVGDTVRIKTDNGNVYGVITDVYRRGKAKNPIALGVWKARVALVDAAREMTIAFSQLNVPGEQAIEGRVTIEKADSIGLFKIIDAFDEMQVDSREERSVVTGNLLAGFDYVNGKGAIINYTASGGQVRQGILLPREFNLEKHQKAAAIRLSTAEMVDAYLREGDGSILGQGKTGQVSLQAIRRGNTLLVTAAKAKSSGGEFFLNRDLTRITGDFVSKSGGMVAESGMERAPEVADVLLKAGVKFEVPAGADDKAKELGRKIVERFRPAPPPTPVAPAAPQLTATSPETFANWKRSVESVGTSMGWTIFNDTIGGGYVLMNKEQRVGPFPDEAAAREYARQTQSVQTATSDFADVAQPERTMTQQQRGEIDARQQQSMARRGDQEGVDTQEGGLFSGGQDEMFSRTAEETERALQEWAEILPRLTTALQRLKLADKVTLVAVDRILNDLHIAGRYRAKVIQIALSAPQDAEYTLDHEVIHALRDLGLFRESEWNALVNAALRDKKLMESVRQRYKGLDNDRLAEEAVADLFAQWRAGRRSQSGFARKALQRILDFLTAVRRAITGANATDQARDIMRRIAEGEVGGRDPDGPGGGGARDSRIGDATNALMASAAMGKVKEAADLFRTKAQDRFLPLLRAQQRIEMQTGKAMPGSANAYRAEELMTGRTGARLDRLANDMVEPLFERMEALGVSLDELETYAYARHAPERNARISSINSQFAEGTGSGMSDAEAAGILVRAEAEGKAPALEEAAKMLDAILKFAVDTRVEAGLLSQEEADAWRETYQHYVPLRGEAELIPGLETSDRPRFGSGINVRGAESKRAFGRRTKAANILAYSIMQAEEAIMRAERNEVARAFYEIAQQNPDPDFWRVDPVTRKPFWNKATGTVSYRNVSEILPEDKDFTVSVKIDGQEHRVTLNRKNREAARLARAMRNLDSPQMSGPLALMSKVNRYLSSVNTALSPEFVITNAIRDIQTAAINLVGIDIDGLVAGTRRDYFSAMAASWKANVRGKGAFKAIDNTAEEDAVRLAAYKNARKRGMSEKDAASLAKNLTVDFNRRDEWGRWHREFVEEGGRVYFNTVEDVNAIAKRINRRLADPPSSKLGQNALRALEMGKDVFKAIDNANTAVESAVRLAAYKNARERGMSKKDAASLAKNLTVNFNRRGEWGMAMNAMYLFYNAGIQGTARLLQAATTKGRGGRNVRRVLMGIAVASFALELLNGMLSGDDEDGEKFYDKISAFEKSRNIIIMIPGDETGDYIKFPMPYGYNVFANIGRSIGSVARGRPVTEAASSIATSFIDAFNPIGGANSILNFIAPTIADPVVDLVQNRDFADRPIARPQSEYGPTEPDSQMYWNNVNPFWKGVAGGLNRLTGGDEVISGTIDVNPETLEYLWGTATGSAGSFYADRVVGNIAKLATGRWDDIEMGDLPMVRKLSGSKPGWYDKAAYYERVKEIEQIASRPKEYYERGMGDKAEAYIAEHQQALSMLPAVKATKREMRQIRSARNDLERAEIQGVMDSDEVKAAREELKKAEDAAITRFNSYYIQSVDMPKRP